jgi:hypothetical protein
MCACPALIIATHATAAVQTTDSLGVGCVFVSAVLLKNLMQFPDRHKWYEAKFAADDMPDWNPGRFVSVDQEAPGEALCSQAFGQTRAMLVATGGGGGVEARLAQN